MYKYTKIYTNLYSILVNMYKIYTKCQAAAAREMPGHKAPGTGILHIHIYIYIYDDELSVHAHVLCMIRTFVKCLLYFWNIFAYVFLGGFNASN